MVGLVIYGGFLWVERPGFPCCSHWSLVTAVISLECSGTQGNSFVMTVGFCFG